MTMTLIATSTVGAGGAASIVLGSGGTIPQTYTDLYLIVNSRITSGSKNSDNMFMQINSVTSGYSNRFLIGTGPVVYSGTNPNNITTKAFCGVSSSTAVDGGGWGSSAIYIPNYAGSASKTSSSDASFEGNILGQNEVGNVIIASAIPTTAAITSITLSHASLNFAEYSTASLYGITKGSGGATVSP